jgi:lipoprotein-anchoring transpeptidase ErfK/SrfK
MTSRGTGLLLGLVIILLGAAAWTATSSQALSPVTIATPTYARSFAIAELAKPTYTPLPPPTIAPTQEPTATLQAIAEAVIVDSPGRASAAENQAPVNYSGGKKILVDISEQHMYVYDGEQLVYSFVSSTGMNNATRTGTFSVLDKIPNAYGATWNIWMPNWLGIYYAGSLENGIHALPILPNGATLWAGFLGSPISYGCVVLDTYDAQVLYDWAEVGVPVEIQW